MKSKHVVVLFLYTIIFLLTFTGRGTADSKKAIDFGKYKSGVYTNSYFNLKVTIPDAWYVMDDKSRIELMKKAVRILAGKDENKKALLEAGDLNSLTLLFTSEYPTGSPVPFNPNFIILAEKVKHLPGIVRGKDYHYHTKKNLESSALKVTFPKEIYGAQIDNRDFDVLEIQIIIGNNTVLQKQYATILNGYALVFSLTYTHDSELYKLKNILQSVIMNK